MIGMNKVEFEIILPTFGNLLLEEKKTKKLKRDIGAGRKGHLKTAKEKFFLYFFT